MTTQTSTAAALIRNSASYTANGVLVAFAITWPLKGNITDLVVTDNGTVKALGTDYTVAADRSKITFAVAPLDTHTIVIKDAVSKHVSGAVLVDPMNTKATNTLADQTSRGTPATVSSTAVKTFSYTGDGTTTKFQLRSGLVATDTAIAVTVGGVAKALTTDYTLAADLTSITFNSAPANAAAIVITVTKTFAMKVDDEQGSQPAFTTTVTRTNH